MLITGRHASVTSRRGGSAGTCDDTRARKTTAAYRRGPDDALLSRVSLEKLESPVVRHSLRRYTAPILPIDHITYAYYVFHIAHPLVARIVELIEQNVPQFIELIVKRDGYPRATNDQNVNDI